MDPQEEVERLVHFVTLAVIVLIVWYVIPQANLLYAIVISILATEVRQDLVYNRLIQFELSILNRYRTPS